MRAGVALGSNLSDRLQNLFLAREAIVELADVSPPILSSSIYDTEPVDCEAAAAQFFNAVLEFGYERQPSELFRALKTIETSLGRPRDHARNLSRNIDIDLLYVDDMEVHDEILHLPHPRMHLRRFVLAPLAEIRPDLVLPNQTKTVRELLASADQSAKVTRLTTDWNS